LHLGENCLPRSPGHYRDWIRACKGGESSTFTMSITRRDLGKFALAMLSSAKIWAKPNSTFAGVEIGIIISPTNFRDIPLRADQVLNNLVQLGIGGIEMQDIRVESYAGAPAAARQEELKQWRLSASMDKYQALHKLYRDAGVNIYAFRLATLNNSMTDQELAYFFDTAEALGARQITTELPTDTNLTQRVGDYAAKRKIWMGYHNHTQVDFNSWDAALSQSKYNGINFDVGHFAAAVSQSPIPFIQKYHDRITCLHLKDRKFKTNGGQNMVWGQGDTPLKEILVLMKQEKYRFPAGIELEYRIPEGSTTMAEIARCLEFCKAALA
jgi:sugar phosphate isomerase/epimerase